jgi:hypothetical protein
MKKIAAFGVLGPVIIGLLGALVYEPAVMYLSGQTSVSAGACQIAFVVFLVMGLVPEWLNLVLVALGRTQLRSSVGAGLFGGAGMAYLPRLLDLPPENSIACALMGIIASLACWWLSIRDPAKPFVEQA